MVFCNIHNYKDYLDAEYVTILILIDGFLQYECLERQKISHD